MRCPVHNVEGCECAYARRWRDAMLKTGEAPSPALIKQLQVAPLPRLLALSFAGALVACGPRPVTCSERDAALLANEAQCLARVKIECAGIPVDEPCQFEDECKAFTRERCK